MVIEVKARPTAAPRGTAPSAKVWASTSTTVSDAPPRGETLRRAMLADAQLLSETTQGLDELQKGRSHKVSRKKA